MQIMFYVTKLNIETTNSKDIFSCVSVISQGISFDATVWGINFYVHSHYKVFGNNNIYYSFCYYRIF